MAAKNGAAQFPGKSVGDQVPEIKEPAQGLLDTTLPTGSPMIGGGERRDWFIRRFRLTRFRCNLRIDSVCVDSM